MTNVFIAPKIKVGFQKRGDTFTGQLAYIIYFDSKGKLRKETSWQNWRDKKIEPQEFDNTPIEGFTLNKDIKRYNGDWFSSNRTMIRIHDPRGFEFEVTTENLIGILMHTDCLRRGLIGQFVYAWVGPELVLLPTNSEEYQQAIKYTTNLSKSVRAKNLIPGVSYSTKREGDVIFIGKLKWHEYVSKKRYMDPRGLRTESNVFVFTEDDGETFIKKDSVAFLSEANSNTPVSNFAELMDKFNKKTYANKIVKFEFRPTTFKETIDKTEQHYYPSLTRSTYFQEVRPDVFTQSAISLRMKYTGQSTESVIEGYVFEDNYNGRTALRTNGEVIDYLSVTNTISYRYNQKIYSLADMQNQKFFDLHLTFENGKEKTIRSFQELFSNFL